MTHIERIKLTANILQCLLRGRLLNQTSKQFHFSHWQHITAGEVLVKYPLYVMVYLTMMPSDTDSCCWQTCNIQNMRKINKYLLVEFNYNLSFITWGDMFDDNDVNSMFNFYKYLLWLFCFSFWKIQKTITIIGNGWVTPTIKALCCFKRDLYLLTKNNSTLN